MSKTTVQQGHDIVIAGPDAGIAFRRVTEIPVFREFSATPVGFVSVSEFDENALSEDELSNLQALATRFALEERRPEDRSGPQLHATFDGHSFGRPFTYEIGEDTRPGTQARAAQFVTQSIREFPSR